MSLAISDYKEIADEINANFSVINSTLCALKGELARGEFSTSYVFISRNIGYVVSYIKDELETVLDKVKKFGDVCVSSPLQMSVYKANPIIIFEYRDSIRDFSESVREIVSNLYVNVGKTLAAYILVYETLEKFGLKPPFVLVESTEFSNDSLIDFIFGLFEGIGPEVKHRPTKAQVITYSGVDISDPLSLLIIGHEAFHIIDRLDGAFDAYCKDTGFQGDMKSRDVFIDIMSTLYFGPVYVYAMQKHFEKRYPLSGESHMEMNIRLLALSYLVSILGIGKSKEEQSQRIVSFINMLERRMEPEARENAKNDKKKFENMLDKGVIGYVKNYFRQKRITTYDEFVNFVEKKEFDSSLEKINREKIKLMLRKKIPVAVRPTTLLNTLYETGDLDKVEAQLITASLKKWYVKRYYEKSLEKLHGF